MFAIPVKYLEVCGPSTISVNDRIFLDHDLVRIKVREVVRDLIHAFQVLIIGGRLAGLNLFHRCTLDIPLDINILGQQG